MKSQGGVRSELLLLRHAIALSRSRWTEPDDRRPLSEKGKRQAARLVEHLGLRSLGRCLSSPAVRCLETVEPIAQQFGVTVEECEQLAEGHDPLDSFRFSLEVRAAVEAEDLVIACTHGDVLEGIAEILRSGALGLGAGDPPTGVSEIRSVRKGGAILLELEEGRPVAARVLPPPPAP